MALKTELVLPAGAERNPRTVEQVADALAETIKAEAGELAKAGYVVTPSSIRVKADDRLHNWLSVTMTAERP